MSMLSLLQSVPLYCIEVGFVFLKINLFIYLFIFGCIGSSVLHMGFL